MVQFNILFIVTDLGLGLESFKSKGFNLWGAEICTLHLDFLSTNGNVLLYMVLEEDGKKWDSRSHEYPQ